MNYRKSIQTSTAVLVILGCSLPLPSALHGQPAVVVLPKRVMVAGVLELRHDALAFQRAPQWTLSRAPVASAGGTDDSDYDLTNASNVQLLSDGRIVTLSPIGNHLYVFAPNGRAERSLGRQGAGPGDIMAPSGMSVTTGDTLIIPDGANNRLNWVVASKGFVANKPLPVTANTRNLRPMGALRSGEIVMSTSGLVQSGTGDGISRPPASVILMSAKGERAKTIASIPDIELTPLETNFRGRRSVEHIPIRFTRFASAIAWDTVIATGSGEGYRIDLRDISGRVRSTISVSRPRRAVTSAMRDSVVQAGLRRLDRPRSEGLVDKEESKRLERATPSADSLAPYQRWFVTPNKTLWIIDVIAPGDVGGRATAFRQDGAILARLTWTHRGGPVAFSNDRVVFRDTDDDDVVSLKVYVIEKGRR